MWERHKEGRKWARIFFIVRQCKLEYDYENYFRVSVAPLYILLPWFLRFCVVFSVLFSLFFCLKWIILSNGRFQFSKDFIRQIKERDQDDFYEKYNFEIGSVVPKLIERTYWKMMTNSAQIPEDQHLSAEKYKKTCETKNKGFLMLSNFCWKLFSN